MKDAYEVVTNKLIEVMESGQIPWRRQWNSVYKDGPPMNATSGNKYRGSNIFLLSLAPFTCNRWVTFKQAKSIGGKVRKGQKAWPVVFWRFFEKKGKDGKPVLDRFGKPEKIPMLRYYMVFNLEQCDGIEIPKNEDYSPIDFTPISRCEGVLREMPQRPEISHGHTGACYLPTQDRVEMPDQDTFKTEEAYYETTFHELAHATGHKSRLGRDLSGTFGSAPYAREELVAEITASLLCAHCHIDRATIENSAAYLQSWMRKLRDDKRLFVTAAGRAAKAADFVLGNQEQEAQQIAA